MGKACRDFPDRREKKGGKDKTMGKPLGHGARGMKQSQVLKLLRSGVLLRFDRTLDEMLQRIVDTARYVIGARYAALAVLDEGGNIAKFFYSGLSKEQADKIGELPRGRGVLGLLIDEGKPLRLRDVMKHPKAYGFPPHHPVMHSFLGVPIFVNSKPFGRLYMTEKVGGRFFTKRDEELAVLLAAQAGVAIERAMLTEQAHQTERLQLLNDLAGTLNRIMNEQAVMDAAMKGVQKALPFTEAVLCLYRSSEEELPLLCFSEGSQLRRQLRRPCLKVARTPFSVCVHDRKPIVLNELRVKGAGSPFERWLARRGYQSLAGVPVFLGQEVMGVLFVVSRYSKALSAEDLTFLEAVAEHVAIALKNARLVRELQEKERARGLLLNKVVTAQEEERRRISKELHDQTGQLLTALLIQLQLLERDLPGKPLKERVATLRRLADDIASQLHGIAWELRPPALDELGLVAALERAIEEWSNRFGIPCDFIVKGMDDKEPSPELAIGVFRIIQEALTNIAKHARATRARVILEHRDDGLYIAVEDNGIGFHPAEVLRHPDQNRKLGLLGMQERAAMLMGHLEINSRPGKGTKIIAYLPFRPMTP